MLAALVYACLRLSLQALFLRLSTSDPSIELLLLRQELSVLRRQVPQPRWRPEDRMSIAALLSGRPRAAWPRTLLVNPEVVLRWHRQLVRRKWALFSRRPRRGRPPLDPELRELILRMARENSRWGYIRIRSELLKLGHRVSATTIRNLLRKQRVPPAPDRSRLRWREFIQAQAASIIATDFFTVETISLRRLHVLFFLELATRRLIWFKATLEPNADWMAQQGRHLTWELERLGVQPRYLICDRDTKFEQRFRTVLESAGLQVVRTPILSPQANAHAERWVGSVRRECLDWMLILGERQLERVLGEYVSHYNTERPHRATGLSPPAGALPVGGGEVSCQARLGGLLRSYGRLPLPNTT